ncbi:uncharacterized protein [Argopecten irradians]|uniref:uncharacterized protein n=1 Tax=Argopecten irradians TaxID=31199 RepID=UPI0037227FC0
MGFSEASVLLKVALFILPLALILQIVGLATPNWSSVSGSRSGITVTANVGLWKACSSISNTGSECVTYPDVLDWMKSSRAFAIIGMLGVAAAAILEALCTIVLNKASHKMAYILATVTAFIGAAAIILSVIIWGVNNDELGTTADGSPYDLSWSLFISIVGGVLSGIGGVLVTIDLCQ